MYAGVLARMCAAVAGTLANIRIRTPPHGRALTHAGASTNTYSAANPYARLRTSTCAHTILQLRLTCQAHVGVCTQPYLSLRAYAQELFFFVCVFSATCAYIFRRMRGRSCT